MPKKPTRHKKNTADEAASEPKQWKLCAQCGSAIEIRDGRSRDDESGDPITAYDCENCGPLQREISAGIVRYVPMPKEVLGTTCKVCRAKHHPLKDGLCEFCGWMADLVRTRLEEAKASKRKPPKRRPKCETCGVPMMPVLFRADADWCFYCDNGLGCRWCTYCDKVHKFDELCPRPQSAPPNQTQ
jgi:hypothetical protein